MQNKNKKQKRNNKKIEKRKTKETLSRYLLLTAARRGANKITEKRTLKKLIPAPEAILYKVFLYKIY